MEMTSIIYVDLNIVHCVSKTMKVINFLTRALSSRLVCVGLCNAPDNTT